MAYSFVLYLVELHMKAAHFVPGCRAKCMLVLLLAELATPLYADQDKSQLRQFWKEKLLAPLVSADPAGMESSVNLPAGQRQLVLDEISEWGKNARTAGTNEDSRSTNWWNFKFREIAPSIQVGSLQAFDGDSSDYWTNGNSWPLMIESPVGESRHKIGYNELPEWMIDAVDREIQSFSVIAARQHKLGPLSGTKSDCLAWNECGYAFVWAGPAVKDGTATYRPTASGMSVRIPGTSAPEIYRLAQEQGWPLKLRLRRDGSPFYPHTPLIVTGSTQIPAWLVSAERLIPAHLTAFSTGGDTCEGSWWVELSYKGNEALPIWAVMVITEPGLATGMTSRRLQNKEPTAYQESLHREIELRWPNDRLPPLRVVAKRFDWVDRVYEQLPDGNNKEISQEVLGSVWGTQVLTPAPKKLGSDSPSELQLSSAGTPACLPP